MVRSSFFNSINGDRVYSAEDWARYFASFISNGVMPHPSTGLQVLSASDGMKLRVAPGKAWINGYFMWTNTDEELTLSPADGVVSRIDRVVIRWSLSAREMTLAVKEGEYAATPTPPPLRRDADIYELALADVTVSAGSVSISQSAIHDLRLVPELCGVSAGILKQVDASAFVTQLNAWFDEYKASATAEFQAWFNELQVVLDENVAANLLGKINQKADIESPALTGTPTAPTPPRADSSNALATTAFVHSQHLTNTGFEVPNTGWVAVVKGKYKFKLTVPVSGVTAGTVPFLHYTAESEAAAAEAGATYIESESGGVVIYAEKAPSATLAATLYLMMGV